MRWGAPNSRVTGSTDAPASVASADIAPGSRQSTGHGLQGRVVAITGGTGSFGSTMAAYLLRTGVGAVHILSRDEAKQHDMRVAFDDPRLRFFIGDVRDRERLYRALDGVDLVVHAAATKIDTPRITLLSSELPKKDSPSTIAAGSGEKTPR